MDLLWWEWIDAGGRGALSSYRFASSQEAKLDRCLDDIEGLPDLRYENTKGLIHPFYGQLKKIKLQGGGNERIILIVGPEGKPDREWREITFLHVTRESNWTLLPSERRVRRLCNSRLDELRRGQRARYERD